MIRIFTLLLFLNSLISANPIKNKADSLFLAENYFDAITEYKRLLFFYNNKDLNFYCNYKVGECYKYGGKYDNAAEYFGKALIYANTDSDIFNTKIMLIRTNLLRKTVGNAEQIVNDLENDYRFTDSLNTIYYWKGWVNIFKDNYKLAIYYFNKSKDFNEIKIICENTEKKLYSLTKAKLFSYFLPGIGQFYTHEYLSGILSLGWVALTGYLTVDSFVANRVFDGFVIGDLLFLRFYKGNVENAEKFVTEKNLITINKTLEYLQENYKGMKP